MNQRLPAVIGLNGPPHSGKTPLGKLLQQRIPDAVIVQPSLVLYEMMQEEGVAPCNMLYHDYKRRPDSREQLIRKSREYRARDLHVYEKRIVDSIEYREARVVIIDNVGHIADEMEFYDNHASVSMLLRLDTPVQELEPLKSRRRRLRTCWEGDSRTPLEHHTMLTAYDLHQMILLLQWLGRPLTPEEAGPYYGIHSIWTRYFAAGESA